MSLNRVVLIGNSTRDFETKFTPAGIPVGSGGIAVQRVQKDEQGNYLVDFFNLTAWRKTAEFMGQHVKKGTKIAVEGRLQSRSYLPEGSQTKRTVYEIVVDNVQKLTWEDTEGEAKPATTAPATEKPRGVRPPPPDDEGEELDAEDPFQDE